MLFHNVLTRQHRLAIRPVDPSPTTWLMLHVFRLAYDRYKIDYKYSVHLIKHKFLIPDKVSFLQNFS